MKVYVLHVDYISEYRTKTKVFRSFEGALKEANDIVADIVSKEDKYELYATYVREDRETYTAVIKWKPLDEHDEDTFEQSHSVSIRGYDVLN